MLINLRNALMAGKRLPYDAEVEYLQSSGTQYINTLVNADSNLSVEITMANAGTPWTNTNPTGAILATPRCRHHLNFNNDGMSNGINYFLGNGDKCLAKSGRTTTNGEIFTFKVDAINKTFALGSFLGTFPNSTFDTGLSYWLFGRNGTTPPYLGALRIYSAKLWNGTTLVRDYIPVRKGTVGYLYDRVSGALFGNAGTGDFVLGPDVVPVEWIRTTGSQCINTGIMATPDSVIRCTLTPISRTYNGMVFYGAGKADGEAGFGDMVELVDQYGNSGHIVFIATGRAANGLGFSYGNTLVTTANCSTGALTVNGTTATTANRLLTGTAQYPLYIGCANVAGTRFRGANCRYHSFAIEQSGILAGSFYPVRVGTEGAMMDVLTRRIYRNAGTGAFGYGNDLKYPIPAE